MMNRPWTRILVLSSALAAFTMLPAGSGAKPKKAESKSEAAVAAEVNLLPSAVDPTFEGFKFGMNRGQVEDFVKGRVRAYYTALINKSLDVRNRDRLTREMNERIDTVATDWIKFDGSQTGWNVSIIRFEFKPGMGEEALHVQEGHDHYYYFFNKGVFFKLVRTYESDKFPDMKAAFAKAFGKPVFKARPGDEDRRFINDMRWHGPAVTVDVEDWTEQFKSYTVRWADAAADAEVLKAWGGPADGMTKLNPLIDAAKEESGPGKGKDPVDDLLGR